ncbi:Nif3-like dinuclear metal center hexameric protein [Endozoicomonas ascidiicola]|uniref:Nif3-like dinuclear metal center hexameric protein n=1 Tax=Endozoicomonas ascidiicola TaxID=1698521 RepID=UPI000829CF91|nr:Nif3-like dinuclear metal center hexameric protein [Endozoicomonas ascidiicola]
MALTLKDMVALLDQELQPGQFKDYCPNGIQVDASVSPDAPIKKIVTGVTACQALIDKAIELKADALLVHHGYFWRGEESVITGIKRRRIESLLANNISLVAYHLPLDAHPVMGNNAELARLMDWTSAGGMEPGAKLPVGNWGTTRSELSLASLGQEITDKLDRKPLLISGGNHAIKTIAWCTGAAQNMIDKALALGVDAFVSGEISESTVHFARENGIHYISAGHHATERYGVQALARWLHDETSIEHTFVDIDSPV